MPWIAAAVAAFELFMKTILPILLLNPIPARELFGETIALGVHIRSDVMSYFASGMAKANASIEGRRAEPERPAIFSLGRTPEPDMVPLPRAVSDRLLEGEILLSTKQIETTYRSLVVRALQNGINHDAKAALERDRIGWIPADSHHGADQFFLCGEHGDVERIARMTVGSMCNSVNIGQGGVMPEIELPDERGEEVSRSTPRDQETESDPKIPRFAAPAMRLVSRVHSDLKPHEQLRSNCTLAVGGMSWLSFLSSKRKIPTQTIQL